MDITARDLRFLAIGAVASIGLGAILTSQYRGNIHQPCQIIDSPLPLIQKTLTRKQQEKLPYAPDALEGARDVATPFGNIRVYEWGPPEGKKVLLVHGISTPCIALGGLAEELVQKGCRVMLFGESASQCSSLRFNPKTCKKQDFILQDDNGMHNHPNTFHGTWKRSGYHVYNRRVPQRVLDTIKESSYIDQGHTII
jgi:hypothetical protein